MAIQKDYKVIAGIIRQENSRLLSLHSLGINTTELKTTINNTALNIANYFEETNPWFNKTQFLMTCEFEE